MTRPTSLYTYHHRPKSATTRASGGLRTDTPIGTKLQHRLQHRLGGSTHAITHLPRRGITNNPHRLPSTSLEAKPTRANHYAPQQASADRILGYTTIPFTYNGEANPAAIRLNNHGVEYLELDLPKAFRCLRDATKLDPDFALAHNNLGLAYLEIGELKQAVRCFNKAIILDETLDIAYGNAGLAHIEAGRYEAAWRRLDQAITLDPDEPIHYNNLGILYLELGSSHDAIECFNIAIQLNPKLSMPYHNRGRARLQIDDYPQANQDFDIADRIDRAELMPEAIPL